ncbi:MAG: RDD family protein [Verrucomicrobia bacterium]|nr:RDD family protein [Verrucomicrobiota bacterium]
MKRNIHVRKLAGLLVAASITALTTLSLFAQTTTEPKTAEPPQGKVELSIGAEGGRVQAQGGDDLGDPAKENGKVQISIGTEGVRVRANSNAENGATVAEPAVETDTLEVKPRLRRHRRQHNGAEVPQVAIGKDIIIKAGERVPGVVVINGSATIDGDVDDVVVCINSEAKINGKIMGELVSIISTVELGPQSEINGETTVVGEQIIKAPGAKIHGRMNVVDLSGVIPTRAWINHNLVNGIFLRPLPPTVKWAWGVTLIAFALNFILALLLARPVQVCAETLIARPIRSFFFGLLLLILSVPFALVLIPTFIGPPLLLCSIIGALVLGRVVVYRAAGGQLGKQLGLPALELPLTAFLVGTLIFYAGYMIPIFGWVLWLIVMPLGAGAVVLSALGVFRREGQRTKSTPAMPYSPPPAATAASAFAMGASAAAAPANPPFPTIPTETATASVTPPLISPPTSGPGVAAAELSSLPRVGFWPRLGATFLDSVLLFVLHLILAEFRLHHGPVFLFTVLAAYNAGMWFWKGTTFGGIVFGLKVVRLDGRPLDWPIVLVRAFSAFLSLAVFGLGFFWASWSAERQSWHDIIAGTTIVKLPKSESLI